MKRSYILFLALMVISQFTFASSNFCFDSESIAGNSMSLKLHNLSKSVEKDNGRKGINCVFNGVSVPNKLSIVAYKNKKGNCSSELRTCKDGTLSGSYAYQQCEEPTVTNLSPSVKSPQAVR